MLKALWNSMQYSKQHANETKEELTKEDVAIIACLIERFFPSITSAFAQFFSSNIFFISWLVNSTTLLLANSYFKVLLWELYHWGVAFWWYLIVIHNAEYEYTKKPQQISRNSKYSLNISLNAFKPIFTFCIIAYNRYIYNFLN